MTAGAVAATGAQVLREHYADRVPADRRTRAALADYIAREAVGTDDPARLDAAERDAWAYLADRAAAQPHGSRRWRRQATA